MKTIDQWVREHDGIRITTSSARRVTRANAPADWDGWEHDAYRVRLTYQGRTMTLPYHKGLGHVGSPPQMDEVLDAIRSDDLRGQTFEEWCGAYGYDSDSRKALATYEDCSRQADKAHGLLGQDAYYELLECEGL